MTLTDAIELVMMARTRDELFGGVEPARQYRRLVRLLHPDRVAPADRGAATDAFRRLTQLWRGWPEVHLRGYALGAARYRGDLADLYDVGADRYLKLPRNPGNNDLMEREALALRALADGGDPRYLPYVPRLVDSFVHRDARDGAERRVNVTAASPGLRSLAEVRRAYPDGVDPRDAAWMWRRLLVALGFAHRAGVVHGAVLPTHVLVEPVGHGVVLVDWCYSTVDGSDAVPALVPEFADWYPEEVYRRAEAAAGTDIAMATRCMTHLMGDRTPVALRRFATGCTLPALRQRPDDAWRLLGELDEVLETLYGPRKFRPFVL